MDRYFLKASFSPAWTEVTKQDWIRAERGAGFWPKGTDRDDVCATAGFGNGTISGLVANDEYVEQWKDFDPELYKLLKGE